MKITEHCKICYDTFTTHKYEIQNVLLLHYKRCHEKEYQDIKKSIETLLRYGFYTLPFIGS